MSPEQQEALLSIQTEMATVVTTVQAYGSRLGKIEDAIITLAATQERVNNIAEDMKAREVAISNFQNSIWEEVRRLNEHNAKMLEQTAILKVRSEDNQEKVKGLEKFQQDVAPQIKDNSTFRGWGERLGFIMLVAFVMGMVGAVVSFNKPSGLSHEDIAKLLEGRTPVLEMQQTGELPIVSVPHRHPEDTEGVH